jgi:hypothetical protein
LFPTRFCIGLITFQDIEKVNERRKFFDEFAKSKNFDPLDAERWYSISGREIIKAVSLII